MTDHYPYLSETEYGNYYVIAEQYSDSDIVTRANFETFRDMEIIKELENVFHPLNTDEHLAIIEFDQILVHRDAPRDTLDELESLVKGLSESYPVLNDDILFQIEQEEIDEAWRDWILADMAKYYSLNEDYTSWESVLNEALSDGLSWGNGAGIFHDGYHVCLNEDEFEDSIGRYFPLEYDGERYANTNEGRIALSLNVLRDAFEAVERGDLVELSVDTEGCYIKIDNGVGIPESWSLYTS